MKTNYPIPILPALLCAGLAVLGSSAIQADIVHNDDIIIHNSLAVGFDAVNGENFSFDTIRLKENNLRIHFDDTSTAPSFPSNDWRIIANDSANGGDSYLAFEDSSANRIPFRVFAGARSNALVVDAQGDVGIGTSTPSVALHAVDGDTPALRLEQDGSSGFSPQTWDVAGNETNFFIRDVTGGSTLPLRIRPGAPTNALFLDATGNVGLGTSSPDQELEIEDAGPAVLRLNNTTESAWDLNSGGGGTFRFSDVGDADVEFQLTNDGNLTVTGTVAANGGADTLPDYVFESDYPLMPLAELESFIEKNGHLPKVPNREDVKKAGGVVNMTEMQMRLLEKVEELTLHTIRQEKRIEDLTGRLSTVEEENEKLRADSK